MSFISRLFGKKEEEQKVGGMEDFMTLIRVYFQAVMAADLGITNLAALPDLRTFKATLKVPTQNNKLGLAEKTRCKKMLKELYGMDDNFTKEIEQSIQETTGHSDLHVSVLWLLSGLAHADGQPDEVQAPSAQHLQECYPHDDREDRERHLHEERLYGCCCHEDCCCHPSVRPEVRLLTAVGYRLCLPCCDVGKKGTKAQGIIT